MKRPHKASARKGESLRQSVTIPARLAVEVKRVAKSRHLTLGRALVVLAERGLEAEAAESNHLNTAYGQFMAEGDPKRKLDAGQELIRAIFGKDAIAEDSIR